MSTRMSTFAPGDGQRAECDAALGRSWDPVRILILTAAYPASATCSPRSGEENRAAAARGEVPPPDA